jgi:pimeloyl-ACP methyl ester carboxylesterase
MHTLPNIVLVHGAWADGSSWSAVIERLQADGYNVTAPQFPLTSLADRLAGALERAPHRPRCYGPHMQPATILPPHARMFAPDVGRRIRESIPPAAGALKWRGEQCQP